MPQLRNMPALNSSRHIDDAEKDGEIPNNTRPKIKNKELPYNVECSDFYETYKKWSTCLGECCEKLEKFSEYALENQIIM